MVYRVMVSRLNAYSAMLRELRVHKRHKCKA